MTRLATARGTRRDPRIGMLSQALMAIADSVFITGADGAITFVNRAFERTYGYGASDVIGRRADMLWSNDPIAEEHVTAVEFDHSRRDGTRFRVSVSHSAVTDEGGDTIASVWVVRDLTERARIETELRRANAELERSRAALQELAVRDELTGLYNRRELNRLLREEVARSLRHGRPLSALLIDVDHFKDVNDTHGHAAGDEVLRALGAQLQASVRTVDKLARYGGEELVAVLPETTGADAMHVAERLRKLAARLELGGGVRITVSIGVAQLGRLGSADELLADADRALYEAKRSGRNRSVLA